MITTAKTIFAAYLGTIKFYVVINLYQANSTEFPISNQVRQAVFWAVVRTGGEVEYDQVMEMFTEAVESENSQLIGFTLQALSASKDVYLCSRTLQLIEQVGCSAR